MRHPAHVLRSLLVPALVVASAVAVTLTTARADDDAGRASVLRSVRRGQYADFLARGRAGEAAPSVRVAAFALEDRPVTRAQFLAFVLATPRWRRGSVPEVLAESTYLADWNGPLEPGGESLALPVTRVSWHAARAYCRWRGRALPTEAQWEWAARADARHADATRDPVYTRQLLAWYARPTGGPQRASGSGAPNLWGVRDLHGLVWEWVEDFGASMVASDDRERGARDSQRVCGAGALSGGDASAYATFMRYAFRSSLRADFALPTLGFRCAAEASEARR